MHIRNVLCRPFADRATSIAIEDADGKKTVPAQGKREMVTRRSRGMKALCLTVSGKARAEDDRLSRKPALQPVASRKCVEKTNDKKSSRLFEELLESD